MLNETPFGVLWDMDGTLVDTEPLWMAAETVLVESFGGTWSHEQGLQLVGNGLPESARILQAAGVRLGDDEIVRWLTDHVKAKLDPASMPWRPGARELLLSLREAGVPTALVTMSLHDMAEHVADHLGFVGFDAIIAGDDVEHAKPHPEPYLRGAAALGIEPARCVAFEDSPTGLRAAIAAGTIPVAIPFIAPIQPGPDHYTWSSLDGRTLSDVLELVNAGAPVDQGVEI